MPKKLAARLKDSFKKETDRDIYIVRHDFSQMQKLTAAEFKEFILITLADYLDQPCLSINDASKIAYDLAHIEYAKIKKTSKSLEESDFRPLTNLFSIKLNLIKSF